MKFSRNSSSNKSGQTKISFLEPNSSSQRKKTNLLIQTNSSKLANECWTEACKIKSRDRHNEFNRLNDWSWAISIRRNWDRQMPSIYQTQLYSRMSETLPRYEPHKKPISIASEQCCWQWLRRISVQATKKSKKKFLSAFQPPLKMMMCTSALTLIIWQKYSLKKFVAYL